MFDEKRRRMLFSTTTSAVHPSSTGSVVSPRSSYRKNDDQLLLKSTSPINSPRNMDGNISPRIDEQPASKYQLNGWKYAALVITVFFIFVTAVELVDNLAIVPATKPFYAVGTCMYFVKNPTANGATMCPKGVCPSNGFTYPCAEGTSTADAGGGRNDQQCASLTNTGQPGIQAATNDEFCNAVCPYYMCGRGFLTHPQATVILCLHHLEAVWFAAGLTFFFFGGHAVVYGMRKNTQLYFPTIVLWLAVTYYMLQHYPHYNLHGHYGSLDNWIELDYCWHLPTAALSIFIARYCYRLIAMSSQYKEPVVHADTWWQQILLHPWFKSTLGGIGIATMSFILLCKEIGLFQYTLIEYNHATIAQMTAIRILDVIHAVMAGVGWTFLFGVIPLIRELNGLRYKIEAGMFSFSVFVMIVNWQWHSTIHYAAPLPYDPIVYLSFEWSIHFSMMMFTAIIAFYITLLIMMARSVTHKPLNKNSRKSGIEQSTTAGTHAMSINNYNEQLTLTEKV